MLVSNPLQRQWGSYPICNLSQFLRIVGLQADIITIIGAGKTLVRRGFISERRRSSYFFDVEESCVFDFAVVRPVSQARRWTPVDADLAATDFVASVRMKPIPPGETSIWLLMATVYS